MSAEERSGWRDAEYAERVSLYSERHRLYGENCPMADIDGIVVDGDIIGGRWNEYDGGTPKCLVEAKHSAVLQGGELPTHLLRSPSTRALGRLASAAGLPAWLVVYDPPDWSYRVWPINLFARQILARVIPGFADGVEMAEIEWVGILYHCRGRQVPAEVIEALKKEAVNV